MFSLEFTNIIPYLCNVFLFLENGGKIKS